MRTDPHATNTIVDVPLGPYGVTAKTSRLLPGQAMVYWRIPKSDGGLPIDGYTINELAWNPVTHKCDIAVPGGSSALTMAQVTVVRTKVHAFFRLAAGYTPLSYYCYAVTAHNALGDSPVLKPSSRKRAY
jgi:hypothetical protein